VRARGAAPHRLGARGVYRIGADIPLRPARPSARRPRTPPWRMAGDPSLWRNHAGYGLSRRDGRLMPPDRVIARAGRPLTLYAEVYDLPAERGVARYDVTYSFEPRGGGNRVTFTFPRTGPAESTLVERLVVHPASCPRATTVSRCPCGIGFSGSSRGVALDLVALTALVSRRHARQIQASDADQSSPNFAALAARSARRLPSLSRTAPSRAYWRNYVLAGPACGRSSAGHRRRPSGPSSRRLRSISSGWPRKPCACEAAFESDVPVDLYLMVGVGANAGELASPAAASRSSASSTSPGARIPSPPDSAWIPG
jgi:hypothetical protein